MRAAYEVVLSSREFSKQTLVIVTYTQLQVDTIGGPLPSSVRYFVISPSDPVLNATFPRGTPRKWPSFYINPMTQFVLQSRDIRREITLYN